MVRVSIGAEVSNVGQNKNFMACLAMWVRRVELLPVKKQFFCATPVDLA